MAAATKIALPIIKIAVPIANRPIVGVVIPALGRVEGVGVGVRIDPPPWADGLTVISAPDDWVQLIMSWPWGSAMFESIVELEVQERVRAAVPAAVPLIVMIATVPAPDLLTGSAESK